MIYSEWHIHSCYSYDATLPLETLIAAAEKRGMRRVGVTDHVNFNDNSFLQNLYDSAKYVGEAIKEHPVLILGVELNPFLRWQSPSRN